MNELTEKFLTDIDTELDDDLVKIRQGQDVNLHVVLLVQILRQLRKVS